MTYNYNSLPSRTILFSFIYYISYYSYNYFQELVKANIHTRGRVNAWKRRLTLPVASAAQGTPVPPFSFHGVLFRYYSEDRNAGVQLRLPVNAPYRSRGWQCRDFLLREGEGEGEGREAEPAEPPPLSPNLVRASSADRRRRHPFSSILFHAWLSLSSAMSLPLSRGRYTTRVFNLVHLIVVGSWVRLLHAQRART